MKKAEAPMIIKHSQVGKDKQFINIQLNIINMLVGDMYYKEK